MHSCLGFLTGERPAASRGGVWLRSGPALGVPRRQRQGACVCSLTRDTVQRCRRLEQFLKPHGVRGATCLPSSDMGERPRDDSLVAREQIKT